MLSQKVHQHLCVVIFGFPLEESTLKWWETFIRAIICTATTLSLAIRFNCRFL